MEVGRGGVTKDIPVHLPWGRVLEGLLMGCENHEELVGETENARTEPASDILQQTSG